MQVEITEAQRGKRCFPCFICTEEREQKVLMNVGFKDTRSWGQALASATYKPFATNQVMSLFMSTKVEIVSICSLQNYSEYQ